MYLLIERVNLLFCREAYIQNIYGSIHIYTSIYLLSYLCVRVVFGRIHHLRKPTVCFISPLSVFVSVSTNVASYEWQVFTFSCKYDFFISFFDNKGIKRCCFTMPPMNL